jgi:hypothetical protein
MKYYLYFFGLFLFAAQAVFAQTVVEKPDYSTTGDNNVKIFAAHYHQYCGGAPISDEEQKIYDIPALLSGLNLYIYSLDNNNMMTYLQDLQTDEKGTAQTRLSVGKYVVTNNKHLDQTIFVVDIPYYHENDYPNAIIKVFFEVENIKKTAIVGYSTATRCPYPDRP